MSIDFPRAWEIAASVEREYHHNECSFNVSRGGVLCDCDVIHKHSEYTDKINFYGAGGIAIQQQEPSHDNLFFLELYNAGAFDHPDDVDDAVDDAVREVEHDS